MDKLSAPEVGDDVSLGDLDGRLSRAVHKGKLVLGPEVLEQHAGKLALTLHHRDVADHDRHRVSARHQTRHRGCAQNSVAGLVGGLDIGAGRDEHLEDVGEAERDGAEERALARPIGKRRIGAALEKDLEALLRALIKTDQWEKRKAVRRGGSC